MEEDFMVMDEGLMHVVVLGRSGMMGVMVVVGGLCAMGWDGSAV